LDAKPRGGLVGGSRDVEGHDGWRGKVRVWKLLERRSFLLRYKYEVPMHPMLVYAPILIYRLASIWEPETGDFASSPDSSIVRCWEARGTSTRLIVLTSYGWDIFTPAKCGWEASRACESCRAFIQWWIWRSLSSSPQTRSLLTLFRDMWVVWHLINAGNGVEGRSDSRLVSTPTSSLPRFNDAKECVSSLAWTPRPVQILEKASENRGGALVALMYGTIVERQCWRHSVTVLWFMSKSLFLWSQYFNWI
jgi:hypothetical protein